MVYVWDTHGRQGVNECYWVPCKLNKDDTHSSLYSWQWSQNHFIAFLTIVRGPYMGTETVEYIRATIPICMVCDESRGVAAFPARRRCWNVSGLYIEKRRSNVRPYLGCSNRAAVWREVLGERVVFHLHPYAMKTHIIQQYMVLFEIRSRFTRMLRGCV